MFVLAALDPDDVGQRDLQQEHEPEPQVGVIL
jgi:hypothetical protein